MLRLNKNILRNNIVRIGIVLLAVVLLQLGGIVFQVITTPGVIRNPQLEHYHFRMQIVVDGKAEDFSQAQYQEGYSKDQCTADLPDHPIHFHDQKDQIVHIHWEGMTGGLVMKYYGWNYIGGPNNSLGYQKKGTFNIEQVPIHGKVLPTVPKRDHFYVYTGDENGYKERSFDDWKKQDLEAFFGVTSNFPAHNTNKKTTKQNALLNALFPKAYAHGSEAHDITSETEGERLTRINNLIGNVVIFVQKDKPTDQQIKDRFAHLEPLSDSTCGG